MKGINSIFIALCFCLAQMQVIAQDSSELIGSREFAYNKKKERVEKRVYDAAHKLTGFVAYKYDLHGNKIETLKYSGDSVLLVRYVYLYDKNNLRIKSQKIDYGEEKESSKLYFYNSEGRNIRTEYWYDSKMRKYVSQTFNKHDNVQSKSTFNSNDEKISKYTYKYILKNELIQEKWKFDKNGELISKSTYKYNKEDLKTEYTIKYNGGKRDSKQRFYHYEDGLCVCSKVYKIEK